MTEYAFTYSLRLSWSGRVPIHVVNAETARSLCGVETTWNFDSVDEREISCKKCRAAWKKKQAAGASK